MVVHNVIARQFTRISSSKASQPSPFIFGSNIVGTTGKKADARIEENGGEVIY